MKAPSMAVRLRCHDSFVDQPVTNELVTQGTPVFHEFHPMLANDMSNLPTDGRQSNLDSAICSHHCQAALATRPWLSSFSGGPHFDAIRCRGSERCALWRLPLATRSESKASKFQSFAKSQTGRCNLLKAPCHYEHGTRQCKAPARPPCRGAKGRRGRVHIVIAACHATRPTQDCLFSV